MKQMSKANNKNHSLISAIVVTLVLLIGLSLLLYPTVADYINSLDYKKDIEFYQRYLLKLDDSERQEILAEAHTYNAALLDLSAANTIGCSILQVRALWDISKLKKSVFICPFTTVPRKA